MELDEFDVHYQTRPSIKGQALANFLMECTILNKVEIGPKLTELVPVSKPWTFHVDGEYNARGSEARVILTNTEGVIIEQALC